MYCNILTFYNLHKIHIFFITQICHKILKFQANLKEFPASITYKANKLACQDWTESNNFALNIETENLKENWNLYGFRYKVTPNLKT